MMHGHVLCIVLLGLTAPAPSSAATPISKVLEMLHEMSVKGEAEKKEEAVKFSAFSQWCDDQTRIKHNEIEAGNQKIELLKAEIAKAAAHIRALTDRIDELEEDVGRWAKDTKSTTTISEAEQKDFVATRQDYAESLEALDKAIAVLKRQDFDRKQAELLQASLLQVNSLRLVPWTTKKALTAFLQEAPKMYSDALEGEDMLLRSAPEANAYEFQSGGVVQMLEKLRDQFGGKEKT